MPAGLAPAQEVRTYASGGFRDCVAVPLITHPIAPWKQDSGPQGHTMWRRPLDGPENAAEMFFGCQTRRRADGERATNRQVTRRGRTYDAPLRPRRASA